MPEGIVSPNSLIEGGATGLLALILVFLLFAWAKGWIVIMSRSTFDKFQEVQDARIKAAEERESRWQEAAGKWQEAAAVLSNSQEDFLEQGQTMNALLSALNHQAALVPRRGRH